MRGVVLRSYGLALHARLKQMCPLLQLDDNHRRFLINFSFHFFFEIRLLIMLLIKKTFAVQSLPPVRPPHGDKKQAGFPCISAKKAVY
jgi:hypothetical protein